MTDRCRRIAIIGAGFSGTTLAIQLLRRVTTPTEILLIDRSGVFGLGLAYSTTNRDHLLNVHAGRMSLFPDEPDHFLSWLKLTNHPAANDADLAHAFLPRADYGKYLQDSLAAAVKAAPLNVRIELITGEVATLDSGEHHTAIGLSDGRTLIADQAVLCLGNPIPYLPARYDDTASLAGRVVDDPWTTDALQRIRPDDQVALIGSGLTMIDIVIDLAGRGHRGTLHAVSRHGLLPNAHAASHAYTIDAFDIPGTIRGQLRWMRAHVAKAAGAGIDWRAVIDAVRPHIQLFWRALSKPERKRFLRHCRAYWDVHRHRTAPAVAARIDALRTSGQLTVTAGRIAKIECTADKIALSIAPRGEASERTLDVDWILNCTGPTSHYAKGPDRLVRDLLDSGTIRLDGLGLGFDIAPDGKAITKEGPPSSRLYALGPPTRGVLWEITAVPDIRIQCAALAENLATDFG